MVVTIPAESAPTPSAATLSFSRLSRYIRCGEAFRLQYIENVPMLPHGAALAGQAVHSVIEEMVNSGMYANPVWCEVDGAVMFQELFGDLVKENGGADGLRWGGRKRQQRDEETGKPVLDDEGNVIMVGENYPWMMNMGPTWVKRAGAVLRRDKEMGLTVVESSVEVEVSAWLDEVGGTRVRGFIDVMMLSSEDGQHIRDWKTGTWNDPMQLANYAWLYEETFGLQVPFGEIAALRAPKIEEVVKVYDLRPWMPSVSRMYHDAVKGIEAEHFQLSPSTWCKSCSVAPSCSYGQTLDLS